MATCEHKEYKAFVEIGPMAGYEGGPILCTMADVKIECAHCHLPFQFIGLPMGLNTQGAAMSLDGQTARLAIAPVGSIPQPLDGALSMGIRGPSAKLDG